MALNLPKFNSGDYNPWISWGASVSKFFVGSENGKIEYPVDEVIIDFENIKTGWGLIQEGQAPTWVWDTEANNPDNKPDDREGWKYGIGATLCFGEGEVYDLDTNSTGAVTGFDAAHTLYEADAGNNAGKVPVFKYTGSQYFKVGKGSTNVPEFELVKWVDRPADLVKMDDAANELSEQTSEPVQSKSRF